MDILREIELLSPVHNLAIRLVSILTAEGRVSDQAFKHDCPQRPPIALLPISLLQKDLWCNIIWCAHSRVRLEG